MRRRDLIGLGLGLASSKLFCAPPAAWDLSCDVAVAGGGGAGLSAALAAAQNGASVMLFEKMPHIGGDTLISGGYFNAVDPARQKVQGICDSEALFAAQILKAGAGSNTRIMAETFAHESTVTLAWLEELGMQFLPEVQEIMGSGFPRGHKPVLPRGTGYVRTLSAAAQKLGVLIRTSMPVLRFVFDRERNRVTGLVVMEKGRPLYVEASRGVVAAFGGFGASRELRRMYAPATADLPADSQPGATGELLAEAADAGAALVNMEYVECVPGAGAAFNYPIRLDYIPSRMIIVNSKGRRFTDETAGRHEIAGAVLKETQEGPCFSIASSRALEAFDPISLKNLYRGRYAGQAWKADTPEALAVKMGLPPEAVAEEVKSASAERSLDKPPFWGAKLFLRVHNTLGGIRIDEHARVLDRNGRHVAGFYAAGEATGSVHGVERIGGNGVACACTFGRIAGKNAALNFRV